jgi:uncharacterized Zn finger protein
LDIIHKIKGKEEEDDNVVCDQCGEKFTKYEELIHHLRNIHHHPIVKCHECGKEFIHEKDRLHHVREEHKNLHEHTIKNPLTPQADVDAHMKNFSDNF